MTPLEIAVLGAVAIFFFWLGRITVSRPELPEAAPRTSEPPPHEAERASSPALAPAAPAQAAKAAPKDLPVTMDMEAPPELAAPTPVPERPKRSTVPPAVVEALKTDKPLPVEVEVEREAETAKHEAVPDVTSDAATVRPPPPPAPVAAPAPTPPPAPVPRPHAAPAPPRPQVAPPAPPAPKISPAPAAAPGPPISSRTGPASSDRASTEAADPERMKARKLARLFVSEIKLYNEKLVAEGKATGNLYEKLKDAIDQSLALFDKRVPEAVRRDFDYMHDELVRQLAGGDATKLGPAYPRGRAG